MQKTKVATICLLTTLLLMIILLSLSTVSAQDQQTYPVNIKVKDGVTGTAAQGVTTTVQPSSGASQNLGTVPAQGTALNLPAGSYTIRVSMDIFGIPITINTTPISVSQATNVEVIVTAYIIPIQYLPLLIYILTAIIGAAIIYGIARSLTKKKPLPPQPPKETTQPPTGEKTAPSTDEVVVGQPPEGYHLKTVDIGQGTQVVAEKDGLLPTTDVLWWDRLHHVWVQHGWFKEPGDLNHMFNKNTGQNAFWDEAKNQWIDSKTGQPIGYK